MMKGKNSLRSNLPTIGVEDLEEGDLLVFTSSGGLQTFCDLIGEPWIHIAVAISRDGHMATAEVGTPAQVVSRQVDELFDVYRSISVARPAVCDRCLQSAVSDAKQQLDDDQGNAYPWNDALSALVILLTRKSFPVTSLKRLEVALAELSINYRELKPNARTCSYFIHELFSGSDDSCGLSVPVRTIGTRSRPAERGLESLVVEDLLTLDQDDAQAILDRYSLMELTLFAEGEGPDLLIEPGLGLGTRSLNDSRMSTPEFLHFVQTASRLVYSIVNQPLLETTGDIDGRWVTPADLWYSSDIGFRAELRPS